jgi:hypothetical protein
VQQQARQRGDDAALEAQASLHNDLAPVLSLPADKMGPVAWLALQPLMTWQRQTPVKQRATPA